MKREVLAGSTVKGRWRSSPLTVTGLGFLLKGPLSSGKRYRPFSAFRGGVLTASAVQVERPQGAMKGKGKECALWQRRLSVTGTGRTKEKARLMPGLSIEEWLPLLPWDTETLHGLCKLRRICYPFLCNCLENQPRKLNLEFGGILFVF